MKKICKVMALLILPVLMFTACGEEALPTSFSDNTIVFNQDETVTYYMVENFDKDYYSVAELKQMAEEEAAEFNNDKRFNTDKRDAVTVENVEKDGANVKIQYHYDNVANCKAHAEKDIYYDTVGNAAKAGLISAGMELQGRKGKVILNKDVIDKYAEHHVVIVNEPISVYVSNKIEYYTTDLELVGNNGVNVNPSDEAKTIVLILSK